ncbi:MAG: hypothetical protein IBJ07_10425 [Rhizobiaceae bacterium]|nr:hypothetical protein [Rhizobiaceae bacterium]
MATFERLRKLGRIRLAITRADGLQGKLGSAAEIASFDAAAQCARMHFRQGNGYWARQVLAKQKKYAWRMVAPNVAKNAILALPLQNNLENHLSPLSKAKTDAEICTY